MTRNYDIAELKRLDVAHHLPPQQDWQAVEDMGGSRIIVRGEGCNIIDGDGVRLLDGMAGLWCVNVGYGRTELAKDCALFVMSVSMYVAAHQRQESLAGDFYGYVFVKNIEQGGHQVNGLR